ncbi:MAG: glycosyltransferase [Gammaproteobacteria bacterium]|nr:glycosyltransferase [Gammaproteobacteria bacterium]
MLLTVALCTHNHASRLERTLSGLSAISSPPCEYEFLIIDNASTDRTPELLSSRAWPLCDRPTRVVVEPSLGIANARNRAVAEARGEYLLFLDDDETPDPAWLVSYVDDIQAHHADAIGGKIVVYFEDSIRPRWLTDELLGFLGQLDYGPDVEFLTSRSTPVFTGNACYRRDVFERIGLFNPRLGRKGRSNTGGEDSDLYHRMIERSLQVRWLPTAIIHHRIQAWKLNRKYFLDLHFKQGVTEGQRKRGAASRLPPKYLIAQLGRALVRALATRAQEGADYSLRLEMNVAYFLGYLRGWMSAAEA